MPLISVSVSVARSLCFYFSPSVFISPFLSISRWQISFSLHVFLCLLPSVWLALKVWPSLSLCICFSFCLALILSLRLSSYLSFSFYLSLALFSLSLFVFSVSPSLSISQFRCLSTFLSLLSIPRRFSLHPSPYFFYLLLSFHDRCHVYQFNDFYEVNLETQLPLYILKNLKNCVSLWSDSRSKTK